MLDFELTVFDTITKKSKLRVLYKTNSEFWRFVTDVPVTLNNEAGNNYKLFWDTKNGTFTINVNGVHLIENGSIKENFNLISSLDEANTCDRSFSES